MRNFIEILPTFYAKATCRQFNYVTVMQYNTLMYYLFRLDKPITVGVTSSSPVYYAFHFTPGIERVLIKVQSSHDTEDICAVASMQIASVSVEPCVFACMYVHICIIFMSVCKHVCI